MCDATLGPCVEIKHGSFEHRHRTASLLQDFYLDLPSSSHFLPSPPPLDDDDNLVIFDNDGAPS